MSSKRESNESLCEKSMQVVTNIIKLSSFSLAKMSPQTPSDSSSSKNTRTTSTRATRSPSPLMPRSPRSLKSQNQQKPVSYLRQPVEGDKSTYVIHDQKKSVDGMASEYIRKVRKKIQFESSEMPNFSAYRVVA